MFNPATLTVGAVRTSGGEACAHTMGLSIYILPWCEGVLDSRKSSGPYPKTDSMVKPSHHGTYAGWNAEGMVREKSMGEIAPDRIPSD